MSEVVGVVSHSFFPEGDGEDGQVSAREGDKLRVLGAYGDGWCEVINKDVEGIFPTAYLDFPEGNPRPLEDEEEVEEPLGAANGSADLGVSNLSLNDAPNPEQSKENIEARLEKERQERERIQAEYAEKQRVALEQQAAEREKQEQEAQQRLQSVLKEKERIAEQQKAERQRFAEEQRKVAEAREKQVCGVASERYHVMNKCLVCRLWRRQGCYSKSSRSCTRFSGILRLRKRLRSR